MSLSAIVLAAGHGTRMKSEKPKVLHEILGKPMVRWAVDSLLCAGVDKIVSVLGFKSDEVAPFVADDTEIVIQKNMAGTGDAVKCARKALEGLSGSVLVTYGDCPLVTPNTLIKLVELREEENLSCAILTMELDDSFGYGRIVRDKAGNIIKNVEQKDASPEECLIKECNTGFYCFDAELLFDALDKIDNNNAQGEYYLTDVIEVFTSLGKRVESLKLDDEDEALGVNDRVQLSNATKILQNRINVSHMLNGVTLWSPETTYIGPDVEIAQDVEIYPQVILTGNTKIGAGTVIGCNTRLENVKVGKNCIVDETIGIDSIIENSANCGPRCYLRPGAHVCEGAKAGTCVEIKKASIGKGSKVPHLSYIGDCEIGEGVNLGAGTITCNYDGENKHKTKIGDETFVGSSTMLVAPVELGNHVLVAAGSVITDDVPDDTLAFGRARQTNKVGRNK